MCGLSKSGYLANHLNYSISLVLLKVKIINWPFCSDAFAFHSKKKILNISKLYQSYIFDNLNL